MNKILIVFIFCLAQQALVECGLFDFISSVSDFAGNIQSVVTEKLLSFKNQVQSLVEKGVDTVENLVNDVVESGFQIKLGSTHLIQTAVEETERKIASMVEDAVKDGKDASHCVRSISSDSVESITNELTFCIESNVLKCRDYVSEGLERIRDFLHISEKFDGDIRACGVGVLSVGCIGLVLGKIAAEAAGVFGKVAQLIKDVVAYIVLFKAKFLTCKGIAMASSAVQLGKFVAEAGLCIEKCVRVNVQAVVKSYRSTFTTTEMITAVDEMIETD